MIAGHFRPLRSHSIEILRSRNSCQKIAPSNECPPSFCRYFMANFPKLAFGQFPMPNYRKLDVLVWQKGFWFKGHISPSHMLLNKNYACQFLVILHGNIAQRHWIKPGIPGE